MPTEARQLSLIGPPPPLSAPEWSEHGCTVLNADCLAAAATFAENSIDAMVTDPPYELGFMGKDWDRSGIAFRPETWRAFLRVLKPGAHALIFGGTRTYHRMACAIEDAGFEVRDSLHWFYGTGFPKSLNVGEGRGTALKPGHEPIVMVRKPFDTTVRANLDTHGTGALNIDACRLGGIDTRQPKNGATPGFNHQPGVVCGSALGRWPANVLLDEDAAAELDAQTGVLPKAGAIGAHTAAAARSHSVAASPHLAPRGEWVPHGDTGGASRFYYVAKPTRAERDLGCDDLPERTGGEATDREEGSAGMGPRSGAGRGGGARNFHPTVKPVALMRYLVRLITPPGGTVLDPFTGSGTTGMAARLEGLRFTGTEREAEYFEIALRRIAAAHLLEAAHG